MQSEAGFQPNYLDPPPPDVTFWLVHCVFVGVMVLCMHGDVQRRMRSSLKGRGWRSLGWAALLATPYCCVWFPYWNVSFFLFVTAYLCLPACALLYLGPSSVSPGRRSRSWVKPLAFGLLWIPVWLRLPSRILVPGVLNVDHFPFFATASVLTVFWFVLYRPLPGTNYTYPRQTRSVLLGLVAGSVLPGALALLGWAFGVVEEVSTILKSFMALPAIAVLVLNTGLPTELIFRGLIHNWLTQKFGHSNLVVAAGVLLCAPFYANPFKTMGDLGVFRASEILASAVVGFGLCKLFDQTRSLVWPAVLSAVSLLVLLEY